MRNMLTAALAIIAALVLAAPLALAASTPPPASGPGAHGKPRHASTWVPRHAGAAPIGPTVSAVITVDWSPRTVLAGPNNDARPWTRLVITAPGDFTATIAGACPQAVKASWWTVRDVEIGRPRTAHETTAQGASAITATVARTDGQPHALYVDVASGCWWVAHVAGRGALIYAPHENY